MSNNTEKTFLGIESTSPGDRKIDLATGIIFYAIHLIAALGALLWWLSLWSKSDSQYGEEDYEYYIVGAAWFLFMALYCVLSLVSQYGRRFSLPLFLQLLAVDFITYLAMVMQLTLMLGGGGPDYKLFVYSIVGVHSSILLVLMAVNLFFYCKRKTADRDVDKQKNLIVTA